MKLSFNLKALGIINLILVVIGIAWSVYAMITTTTPEGHVLEAKLVHLLTVIALLAETLYCLSGYKKDGATYYKITLYIYAAVTFGVSVLVRSGPVFLLIFSMLSFGIICILAFGKDLGEKLSYTLFSLNAIFAVVRMMAYVILMHQVPGSMFGSIMLSVILAIMIYAKYEDKANRKSGITG